jgi:rRNA biogenesis protein RRP5
MQTNKNGCFVRLSRSVEGRSTLKELCDGFIPKPEESFPTGRLVVGKVKGIRPVSESAKDSNHSAKIQVDLDMRESTILQDQENRLTFNDINVGDKYKGSVQRLEDYGVFVQIENSNISGLVHLSECSEKFIKNLGALYAPGDLVKVLVLKKDEEHKKLGLSMKASHFADDEDSDESSVDSDAIAMEDDDDDENEDVEMDDIREIEDESDVDKEDLDSDDENFASKLAARMDKESAKEVETKSSDDDSEDNEDDNSSSSSSSEEADDDGYEKQTILDTDVGFNWDAGALDKKQVGASKDENGADSSDDSDSDDDSDDNDEDDNQKSKSHKSRKRQAEKRREEREISRREMALADGTADENPETAGDFERLLAGDPNNSELWIRYMAFYLSLADIPTARKVADKAMDRIEFRHEKEKLNVWTALLTLEHKYGSEETFHAAIDRACSQNNPKYVYLRACEILEKDLANNSKDRASVSRADALYTTMCKKHKSKKKVWLAHMQYLLRQSRHQEAHALMKRALLSLAPYKQAETMSKFAQMEFEHGSAERARTLFDGLILKYPKRLDLFFVYLDKECKNGTIDHARTLLEKKVEESKLSDRQMKSLFKKWYRIEEDHGTDETKENVKNAARTYVSKDRN